MAQTTDAMYNASSRYLQQKIVIHFAGIDPVIITKDDYLISSTTLEEAHASGSAPFGKVTSNELTLKLLNEGGVFSPSNTTSAYYGKMSRGVKIEIFMRPAPDPIAYDWDPMGVYYVTKWTAQVTGLVADVTANDNLYKVFNLPDVNYLIRRDLSYHDFYTDFFGAIGITAEIDAQLTNSLKYAYITQDNKAFLSELGLGALSDCYCKHNGSIYVDYLYRQRTLRATLTDSDQIISVNATQSIENSYDGVSVDCNLPQESIEQSVLNIKNLTVGAQQTLNTKSQLTATPLIRVSKAATTGAPHMPVKNLRATTKDISFDLVNSSTTPQTANVELFGTIIDTYKVTYTDNGDDLLKIDNKYIQTFLYASKAKDYLHKYVSSQLPTLSLKIRGNPKLELGDKIRVISTRYKLDYTGVIVSIKSAYSGSFSTELVLIDSTLLEEVI